MKNKTFERAEPQFSSVSFNVLHTADTILVLNKYCQLNKVKKQLMKARNNKAEKKRFKPTGAIFQIFFIIFVQFVKH